MKNNNQLKNIDMKKNIYLHLFFMLSFLFTACTGMDEKYKEFLEDSDILYTGKVDSVEILTGIERIKFNLIVSHDPKVKKLVVYWNSRQKSKEFEITANEIGERKEIELPSIAEGFHTFEIISYDENGAPSVPQEIVGQVYGDKFKAKVNDRNISSALHTDLNEVTIKWGSTNSSFDGVRVEVHYTDINGNSQKVKVEKDEVETVISNYKEGILFQLQTFVRPDSSCIDEFSTELKKATVPIRSYYDDLKVESWKVIDVSEKSDRPQNPASNCIDGDLETLVHSNAGSAFPHHITFDMGSEFNIDGFYVVQRWTQPTQQAKDMTIYASETGEKDGVWTELTSHVLLQVTKKTQDEIPLSKVLSTRYFKFVFTSSWEKDMFTLNEIGAYVKWR